MKIEEQVLSREQMAHLVELGVDTSDASMVWVNRNSKSEGDFWYLQPNNQLSRDMLEATDDISYYFKPTYTIGDLIEKLPKEIAFTFSCASYKYEKLAFRQRFVISYFILTTQTLKRICIMLFVGWLNITKN